MSRNSADNAILRFQSEANDLRHTPRSRLPGLAIWIVCGLVIALFLAAFFVRLDRVVTTLQGKVVATGGLIVLQALDPSVVKSIDVKEGQEVKQGQLLATLDPTFAAADVEQLEQQVASLNAQIVRAEAEQAGQVPVFDLNEGPEIRPYVLLQTSLHRQRQAQYAAQLSSYDQKIEQARATVLKLEGDDVRLGERSKIVTQIEQMRQTLMEKDAGSLYNLLLATDQKLEILRTMENGQKALIEARHSLAALESDRDAFVQQWGATLSQEIVTARNNRDAALAELTKAARRRDLVELHASEHSMVLSIAKLSVGSVLREGEVFLTLAPLSKPVEAEIKIATSDVGFVRAGDPVTIKVDAFDFMAHGRALGELLWVSEGSFTTDDNGQPTDIPYYKGRVAITEMQFHDVPASFRLVPGMTLSADIHIGTRTLFQYIAGGVARGFSGAMREP